MEDQKTENGKRLARDGSERNVVTSVIVVGLGVLSILVLAAPSLLPDVIPVLGKIDEVTATTILISCFAYFGVDIGGLFGRKTPKKEPIIDVEAQDR
jgi:hypothetical protein